MSTDMFPQDLIDYLVRHRDCDDAEDHGSNCPDLPPDREERP